MRHIIDLSDLTETEFSDPVSYTHLKGSISPASIAATMRLCAASRAV